MLSTATLVVMSGFFLCYALGVLLDINEKSGFFEILTGTFAAISALFILLEIGFSWSRAARSKYIVFFTLALFGSQAYAQDLSIFAVERAKVAAAESVAMTQPDQTPTPTPGPTPGPETITCTNCGGDGKVPSGDGLSEMNCQVCDGDGKVSATELKDFLKTLPTVGDLEEVEKGVSKKLDDELYRRLNRILEESLQANRESPEETPPTPAQVRQPAARPLQWVHTLADALTVANREGKPVFIYWTTEWCAPCKVWERETLPEVVDILQNFVCVKLDADEQSKSSIDQWEIGSVPIYFVVVPDIGHKRLEGTNPDQFKSWLREAATWAASLKEKKAQLISQCKCAETGICACGDDCRCQGCPEHTPKNNRLGYYIRNTALWSGDWRTNRSEVSLRSSNN